MKKTIQLVGLALFIVGFGLWVGTFFLSNFHLTDEILRENFGSEQEKAANAAAQERSDESEGEEESMSGTSSYQLVREGAKDMLGKTYDYNLPFISDLNEAFARTNERVKEVYGISPEEIDQIVEKVASENELTYAQEVAVSVFPSDDVGETKKKSLRDYTGWMEGKTFESKESLKSQLAGTVEGINNGVIEQKGIGRYQAKGLKTSIVKAATVGVIRDHTVAVLLFIYLASIIGALMYLLPRVEEHAGIKNNHIFHSVLKHRGWLGILVGTFLIVFYVFLYFYPYYLHQLDSDGRPSE